MIRAGAWENLVYYTVTHKTHGTVMLAIISAGCLRSVPRDVLILLYSSCDSTKRRILREQLCAYGLPPIDGIISVSSPLRKCWKP